MAKKINYEDLEGNLIALESEVGLLKRRVDAEAEGKLIHEVIFRIQREIDFLKKKTSYKAKTNP